jgi:hypothetical protein
LTAANITFFKNPLCTLKKILKGMGENVPEEKSLKGIDNRAVFFPLLAACAQKARPAQAPWLS